VTGPLIILAAIAVYAVFALVRPDKACGKCSGWGLRTRRRRSKACPRCKGTGKQFRLGARLVHSGAAQVIKYVRERLEQGRAD